MTALPSPARVVAEALSGRVLDVCRTYLSNGRRNGRYWSVGDLHNARGASLYVRLTGPSFGRGAAGHWSDTATGEHGDLLDLIRMQRGLSLVDAIREAERFVGARAERQGPIASPEPRLSEAAQRLFALGRPIPGTAAERYLRARGISCPLDLAALRYHPGVYCRELGPGAAMPALLAAITDLAGGIVGVQRTWLDPLAPAKARLQDPRRSLGDQLGHAARFGRGRDVLLAGEGVETVLSLRSVLPDLAMAAALSATHLGAMLLPERLSRLYIARDADRAGYRGAGRLRRRAQASGIEVAVLRPERGDFNSDLQRLGPRRLLEAVGVQLHPEDVARYAPALASYGRAGDAPPST